MSNPETSPEQESPAAVAEREAKQNRANLGKVGPIHLAMVMGAITLWGAADSWAFVTGWGLARVVAVVNAIIAGSVITGVLHEWGHYAGARLAGSNTQVLPEPAGYFFMFNFPFDKNDRRQFLWMSWGGILVPWMLVLATLAWIPIDNASRAMLLAVFVTRAVQVSVFEVPVARRTSDGGEPQAELERQLVSGFQASRYAGVAIGALVWLLA